MCQAKAVPPRPGPRGQGCLAHLRSLCSILAPLGRQFTFHPKIEKPAYFATIFNIDLRRVHVRW